MAEEAADRAATEGSEAKSGDRARSALYGAVAEVRAGSLQERAGKGPQSQPHVMREGPGQTLSGRHNEGMNGSNLRTVSSAWQQEQDEAAAHRGG